jgi:hypothetical protein
MLHYAAICKYTNKKWYLPLLKCEILLKREEKVQTDENIRIDALKFHPTSVILVVVSAATLSYLDSLVRIFAWMRTFTF